MYTPAAQVSMFGRDELAKFHSIVAWSAQSQKGSATMRNALGEIGVCAVRGSQYRPHLLESLTPQEGHHEMGLIFSFLELSKGGHKSLCRVERHFSTNIYPIIPI